jgi:hypothetical protein
MAAKLTELTEQTPSEPIELEEAVKTAGCFACKMEALISRTLTGTEDCMMKNIPERVTVGKAERQQRPSQDWRKENWDAMRAEVRSPQSKDKDQKRHG